MLKGNIDLHIHTNCSDGLDSPESLVENMIINGYKYVSITDHDTVKGVIRGLEVSKGTRLEIIPGIELSSVDGDDDIHILGYYFDYNDAEFIKRIAFFKEKRAERAEEIVKSLNRLGLEIHIDTVIKIAHGAPVGRPHIAEALLSEELIDTYNEAFVRYIGSKGPAYVPKYKITPREAIELIRVNGGIPVLAHPAVVGRDEIIDDLVDYGLMGIEAIHPFHTSEKQYHYEKLAKKYGLIVTGGSDWHGLERHSSSKQHYSGRVPEQTITQMKLLVNSGNASESDIA